MVADFCMYIPYTCGRSDKMCMALKGLSCSSMISANFDSWDSDIKSPSILPSQYSWDLHAQGSSLFVMQKSDSMLQTYHTRLL